MRENPKGVRILRHRGIFEIGITSNDVGDAFLFRLLSAPL